MIRDINFNGDIHRILVPLFELRNYRMKQITVRHNKRNLVKPNIALVEW